MLNLKNLKKIKINLTIIKINEKNRNLNWKNYNKNKNEERIKMIINNVQMFKLLLNLCYMKKSIVKKKKMISP